MNTKLFASCILFFSFFNSFGQLEVIDKIGSLLIPNITKGINEVIETTSKAKAKKDDLQKIQTELEKVNLELKTNLAKISKSIDSDIKNLDGLNNIFETTSLLYDDISTMKVISKSDFLDVVLMTNKQELLEKIATEFNYKWGQVQAKKTLITNQKANVDADFLKHFLGIQLSSLDKNYIDLNTSMSMAKPTMIGMSFDDYKLYITNMKKCYDSLDKLEDNILNINLSMISVIQNYSSKIKSIKDELPK